MLEWKEIKGLRKINYIGNQENGVDLPEENEEVLFCRSNYRDETKDIYFSGYIYEGKCGLVMVNSITGGTDPVEDGIKWARFNKPETKNNKQYAIAYLDKNGNGFMGNIPNIINVEKSEIKSKVYELKEENCKKITVFTYIMPCSFNYDWDFINAHKIS